MDRIVSQLLAELDGMAAGEGEGGAEVFVMGATNRPDLLDPALLRPGRFDRMLYLGVSDTHKAQQDIMEALTRKFRLDPNLSLKELAERCPFNYTGADFYALCSDAMLNAMTRKAEEIEVVIGQINANPPVPNPHPHPMTPQYYLAEIATAEEMQVLVSQADFDRALANLVPSVSEAEMEHYGKIQKKFSQDRAAVGGEDAAK
jgi:peroxin-6